MRNSRISLIMLLSMLCLISCSKEEATVDKPEQTTNKVTLSFDATLKQFAEERAKENFSKSHIGDDDVPECQEEETPLFIRAVIKKQGGGFVDDLDPDNGHAVDIRVINNPTDSDNDGLDNWLTYEESFLELEEGTYELLYFAVHYAEDGPLPLGEEFIMWLAPSEDDDYGPANFENFVDDPLPHTIELEKGTKHYDKVEVLCYDPHYAEEYGYLFFDFEMVPLTYLCFFGNECDDTGRHFPSNFRVKIWEHNAAEAPDSFFDIFIDSEALVNEVNHVERNTDGTVRMAKPLCVPLPDRDGENLFYGEIWTIDENGVETLIRQGDFTDEQTKDGLLQPEGSDNLRYWHFREGEYCGQDSDLCLLSSLVDLNNNFNEPGGFIPEASSEYLPFQFQPNEAGWGKYVITTDPNNFHEGFPSQTYMDNMIVFDGDVTDPPAKAYYTCQTPPVCEGDYYYVSVDLLDLSNTNDSNLHPKLKVIYKSDGGAETILSTFDISQLPTNTKPANTVNNGDWKTVGFIMQAETDGNMRFSIEDSNLAGPWNDFAMDNVRISNDPQVIADVIAVNGTVNPNN